MTKPTLKVDKERKKSLILQRSSVSKKKLQKMKLPSNNPLFLELEQIISEKSLPAPQTIREICFRSLPLARFRPHIREQIKKARKNGRRIILVCRGKEVHVKEILYVLRAFELFDEFWILDEMDPEERERREKQLKEFREKRK